MLVTAHTDTVFPADTPLTLAHTLDRITGPGIGDNSLGVAGLCALVWALEDEALPGEGDLYDRFIRLQKQFAIPEDKLEVVFQTALDECRKRTLAHVDLPDSERFAVEYVQGQPWGAYNWYKGNYLSLIQVNTTHPSYIDHMVPTAAHEGYPGHHVYNVLLEKNLVHDRGWIEYTVYPLYSPQSLIAEGTANIGDELIFPGNERAEFEKKVLYPLAGLDSTCADLYNKIQNLKRELSSVTIKIARSYLDGHTSREEALNMLMKR